MIQTLSDIDKKELYARLDRLKIACIIVFYEPSKAALRKALELCSVFPHLWIIDNSPLAVTEPTFSTALQKKDFYYQHYPANLGVAAALNVACEAACETDLEAVLTLDQDSDLDLGMLLKFINRAEKYLHKPRVGILSVRHMTERRAGTEEEGAVQYCDVVMTSGNLVNLEAWQDVGGYCEKLFIDTVDHDFCLRLRYREWYIIKFMDVQMFHRVGSRLAIETEGDQRFRTEHPPQRFYYIARNNLRLWRLYGKRFPDFIKLRKRNFWNVRMKQLLLYEKQKIRRAAWVLKGFVDYMRGRYGKL